VGLPVFILFCCFNYGFVFLINKILKHKSQLNNSKQISYLQKLKKNLSDPLNIYIYIVIIFFIFAEIAKDLVACYGWNPIYDFKYKSAIARMF
jgi:hypothetical protein